MLLTYNSIYTPDFPVQLLSPQLKAKGYNQSHFTTDEKRATLFHGGDT
jgi:hypothetical protein